jgi:hypothetical protein
MQPMYYIGLDVHKRKISYRGQFCIIGNNDHRIARYTYYVN